MIQETYLIPLQNVLRLVLMQYVIQEERRKEEDCHCKEYFVVSLKLFIILILYQNSFCVCVRLIKTQAIYYT